MKLLTTLQSRVPAPVILLGTIISAAFVLTASADLTNCAPAPPGLVGWWAGESSANDSAGTNNGALHGGMNFVAGEAGQAFNFNGGSGYVEMPASAGLNVGAGAGLTFECWIKPAALADAQPLVEWNSGAHAGLHLWISQPPPYGSGSGSIYVNLIDTTGAFHTLCTAAGILNTNGFQHVALSYDKASGMTSLYYNGALVALGTLGSFSPQTSVPLYLGKRISDAPFVAFDGLMDEASLYNRALNAAEIQAVYNADGAGKCLNRGPSCTPPPAGLVSWWRGERAAGDSAGTNNGTLSGGMSFVAGEVGQAFSFDGSSGYVNIPASASLNVGASGAFTVEGWIKPASATANEALLEWNTGGVLGVHLWISQPAPYGGGSGSIYVNLVDTTGTFHTLTTSGGLLNTNGFQHVALTYDQASGTASLYYNGALAASQSLGSFTPRTSLVLNLGERPGSASNLYHGLMDEVSLYNRALTAAEIQAIYNADGAGKCLNPAPPCATPPAGLVSWWAAENSALDRVSTNNGTLVGNASYGVGEVGQTFVFDGNTGSGVRVGGCPNLQLQNFTMETWVRRSSLTSISSMSGGILFGFGVGGYNIYLDSTGHPGLSHTAIDTVVSTGAAISDLNFHHVAVTKSGSTVIFYVDGVASSPANYGAVFTFTAPAAIGSEGDNLYYCFLGAIDEMAIYNRALSAAEVQSIYNVRGGGKCPPAPPTNCTPPPAGLVGWWRGESNADDSVGGHNGTLVNGTGFAPGEVLQAFSFDGVQNCVTNAVPGLTNIRSSFTMEFWAWPKAARASTAEAISGLAGISNQRYAIFPNNYGGPGGAGAGVSVGTNGVSVFEHSAVYLPSLLVYNTNIAGWTHIAVVYSNRQPRLYLNGALVRTGLTSSADSYPSTCLGEIGLGYGYYAGLLDEVSIYNRALSAADIQAIYRADGTGKCHQAPTIVVQPADLAVTESSSATFTVTADGTPPLGYQWRWNGTNIAGATSTSLTLNNVPANSAGSYSVLVTNAFGAVTSQVATLSVRLQTTLLNVNFAAYSQVKVGFAGTGQTASDFWNNYTAPFQPLASLSNLALADGTPTTVGLTVQNGAGHWAFTHPDLMYNCYCYSQNRGDITLTVTNLPSGEYDFYLYGHAGAATANTAFQLLVGGADYGRRSTATNSDSALTNFVEGAQYVVYRNVAVTNGGAPVTIKAHPGLTGDALLNGMQINSAAAVSPVPTQRAQIEAIAPSGSASSTMQLEIRGAPNRVYVIQASTNLMDWVPIGLCATDTDGNVRFMDPDADKYPTRLYRVVEQ